MKMMTVGHLKARFSEVLEEVNTGETIGIEYGRSHTPVAMIVPFPKTGMKKRKLGLLKEKAEFSFVGDGEISDEEFLAG